MNEDLWAFHDDQVLALGCRYKIELQRKRINYSLRVFDEDGRIIIDSGSIAGVDQDYRYIWLASTIKARRNNGNYSSGYIERFEIS